MSKVTVILGPPASGKSREIEKVINDRPAMHVGSMSSFGLKNDPFYISKLLIKAATIGKLVLVIDEVGEELRNILLVLVITGFPVDVILATNAFKAEDVSSFIPYITLIDLWKK